MTVPSGWLLYGDTPFCGDEVFFFVPWECFLNVHTSNTICVGLRVFGTHKESKTDLMKKNTLSVKDSNKTGNVCITQHWGAFVQPLLLWKRNKYCIFWECKFSLRHPACNAHAPYRQLWTARHYIVFPHYIKNGTLRKKVIEHKMYILIISIPFVWNISHSKMNWARYVKNVYWSSCKASVILVRF